MILPSFGGLNTDIPALEALAEHLQSETEERSRVLARDLHDNVGGSLVAAIMDVAWLTRNASPAGSAVSERLNRIDSSLTKAVEATRRLVDELQPALIDSLGLFGAVSAHFGRECRRCGLQYSETMVGVAPEIDTDTALNVFRIAQAFLQWIREDAAANTLYARFEGDPDRLIMRFVARGVQPAALSVHGTPRLASIGLRLRKLHGTLRSEASRDSLTILLQIPANASHPQVAA